MQRRLKTCSNYRQRAAFECLEFRRLLASDWQNTVDPLNVSADAEGFVSPLDVLLIVNELNQPQISDPATGQLPAINPPELAPPPFLDVDGDGYVSPVDAIRVINGLREPVYPTPACDAAESRMEYTVPLSDAPAKGAPAGRFIAGDADFAGDLRPFVPAGNGRIGVAAFALDGDYVPDIVSVSPTTDEVLVFLDMPDGILGEPARYPSGGLTPITVTVGDFVDSPEADIVVGHMDGSITFLVGRGSGQFELRPELTVQGPTPVLDLTSGDWDGDGDQDLAVSNTAQVSVLDNDDDPLSTPSLINGNFSQSLIGWNVDALGSRDQAGSVTAAGGAARLQENDSFLVSLHQTFAIPPAPQSIRFDLLSVALEHSPGGLPDAFEVSLLDEDNNPLVGTIADHATAFLSVNPDGATMAAGVSHEGTLVTLGISALAPGTTATLYFDLVGNEHGGSASAVVDNVRVEPDSVTLDTFAPSAIDDAPRNTGGISHCDADTDGDLDLILATADGEIVVLTNDGDGRFQQAGVPQEGAPAAAGEAVAASRPDGPRFAKFHVVDSEADAAFQYGPDGTPQGTFALDRRAAEPRGVTSAGDELWIIDGATHQIFHHDARGKLLGTWTAAGLIDPQGIASDGVDLWVVDAARDELLRYERAVEFAAGMHAAQESVELASVNSSPTGVTTDGETVWVVDDAADSVFAYSMTGEPLGQWRLDPDNRDPSGIAFDHGDLWVVDRGQLEVFRYVASPATQQDSISAIARFTLAAENRAPTGIADPPFAIGEVVADSIAVEGEVDTFTFDAEAGAVLYFDAQQGSPSVFRWSLASPSGAELFDEVFLDQGPMTLAESGTYTLEVRAAAQTGAYQFQVHAVPPTSETAFEIGQVVSGAIEAIGETDAFVFQAAAGDNVYFDARLGSPSALTWSLVSPTGTVVFDDPLLDQTLSLTESGTYRLIVDGRSDQVGTYEFQIHAVPPTEIVPIHFGNVVSGSLDVPGETDQYELQVAAGDILFFDAQVGSQVQFEWSLVSDSGASIFDGTYSDRGHVIFDAAGTYTLTVDGRGDAVGPYQFQVYEVPPPATLPVELRRPAIGELTIPGEFVHFTLEGTEGQTLFFDHQAGSSLSFNWQLVDASGEVLFDDFLLDQGPLTLPASGQYTITVDGRADLIGPFTFVVWDVPTDEPRPIEVNSLATGAIVVPGQTGSFAFEGEAGQEILFDLVFNQRSSITYSLRAPSGAEVFANRIADQSIAALPESGTYTLTADGTGDSVGAFSFQMVAGNVPPPLPEAADLEVVRVDVPTQVIGDPAQITAEWEIINHGPATIAAGTSIRSLVTLSADDQAGSFSDDPFLSLVDATLTDDLPPGERLVQRQTFELLSGLDGELRVAVQTDIDHVVFEGNEQSEIANNRLVSAPVAIYPDVREVSGRPQLQLDVDEGATFPAGTTITLSGRARAIADAVNLIFIADLSGSTAAVTGLDANRDGVVDELDNLNGDDRVGDILDAEIGAVLETTRHITAQSDSALVSIIAFGGRTVFVPTDGSEPVDLGPGLFNQSFIDPSADADRDGTPDFARAASTMYFFSPGLGGFAGAREYRNISIGTSTDFGEAIRELLGLLERAPAADQTHVFFLTDGMPSPADAVPTDEELDAVAAHGVTFGAFQITGDAVTAPVQRLADRIDAGAASRGGATLVRDVNELGSALVDSVRMVGVTLNGRPVESFDADGNFFAPVTIAEGENVLTFTAIDSQGRTTSRTITLNGVDEGEPDFEQLQDVTSLASVSFRGATFNRQTRTLHALMELTNDGSDPLVGPVYVTFDRFGPPAVTLANPDRLDSLGRPTMIFLDPPGEAAVLPPGETSAPIAVELLNTSYLRFDFDVTVRARGNTAPAFTTTPPVSAAIDVEYVYDAAAEDAEDQPLTFRLMAAPDGMTVDAESGRLRWTPRADQAGSHRVELLAEDGFGGLATQTFQLSAQLDPPNRPPIFQSVPILAADPGADYTYAVVVSDADGDDLSYSLEQAPNGMSIDGATGVVSYPNAAAGEHDVSIRVDDGQGGTATQSYRLSVGQPAANAGIPVIQSTPSTIAVVDTLYLYLPLAQDADGDPLLFSLVTAPANMSIDPSSGRIEWTPDASQVGTQVVALRVDDGRGGLATQLFAVDVSAEPVNRPPFVTTAPTFVASQDEAYVYDADALDPDGDRISFELLEGPSGMTIDAASGLVSFTPDASHQGVHRVRLSVVDGSGAAGFQSFDLDVRAPNTPPAFQSTPITEGTVGVPYRYRAAAVDAEDRVLLSLLEGPAGMTIEERTGIVRFVPATADVGEHTVTVRATDERGAAVDQTFVLTIASDVEPPEVSVTLSSNLASPGESVTIHATASDNVALASLSLTVDGQPLALDAAGLASFTTTSPGLIDVVATAFDSSNNEGSAAAQLRVIDPADTTPPDVALTDPAPGARVTYLTEIVGTAAAADLEFYRLEYARADRVDLNDIGADNPHWVSFAQSGTSVTDAVLGVFDPTLLANDDYVVRLIAQDFSGNINVLALPLSVEGQAKLGQFDVEFVDLTVPLAGISIDIRRRYSTLDAGQSGDFGFGWSLGVAQANIRETVPLGLEEQAGLFGATPFKAGTRVYLTDPDGRRIGFTFTPQAQGGLLGPTFVPEFTPDDGVYDRLVVDPVALSQRDDGSFALFLFGLPYNPSEYQLVRPDGTVYRYDQFDGLQDVTDRNGNQLVFSDEGILHSSGEAVRFERDEAGRISRIIDPAGNGIEYRYDARGDLVAMIDQTAQEHTFSYFADPPHYLDRYTNASGVSVRNEYDAAGRLIASTDGLGNPVRLSYDLANHTELIADRLGKETTIRYDDRGNLVSLTDPRGATIQVEYDEHDNAMAVTDARGFVTRYAYDEQGNVLGVTNALGDTLAFTYNAFGDIVTAQDELGRVTQYVYDDARNLREVINREGARSQLTHDEFGRPTSLTDNLGNVHRYEYDSPSAATPTRVTDPDGTFRTIEYNDLGQPTRVVDGSGRATGYEYDSRGRLTAIVDSLANRWTFEYDGDRLVRSTDALGRVTRFEYDAGGRLLREIDPLGGVTAYTYDAADQLLSETDPLGRTTTYRYDDSGNLLSRSINPTTQFEYDAAGNITAIIDPNGNTTRFEYDALGRLVRRTNALGGVRTLEYDAIGNVIAVTDEKSQTTRFEYDAMDRLVRIIDPLGHVQERTYDVAGNMTALSDLRGSVTRYQYDGLGRVTRIEDAGGGVTQIEYDGAGRVVRLIDPLEQVTQREYDAAGNPTGVVDALGGRYQFEYDAVGNLTRAVNPLDDVVEYTYDDLNRQTSALLPNGSRSTAEYDAVGNPISLTDALGNVTQFEYDTLDRMVRRIDPLGNAETFSYDDAGNLIAVADRNGARRQYEYDAMHRMIAERWLDDNGVPIHSTQYTYDPLGNLLTASDPLTLASYTYDALNRLTGETVTGTGPLPDYAMSYVYDPSGRVVTQQDQLGAIVTSTYTPTNLLASRTWQGGGVEPLRVDFQYDLRQDLVEVRRFHDLAATQPAGSTAYEYDAKRRLTRLIHRDASGNPLVDYQYVRDAADRLVSQSHHGEQIQYTNDRLGQILGTTREGVPDESFEYDLNGNRVGANIVVGPNNRVASDGEFSYEYDAAGRLVARTRIDDGTRTEFAWDHRHRLTRAEQRASDGTLLLSVAYQYDQFDRRISKTVDPDGDGPLAPDAEHFWYSGDQIWADLDSAGNVDARYLHGAFVDEVMARERSDDGVAWYLGDQLGTVRDIAGLDGQLIDHLDYATFGAVNGQSNPAAGDRFQFTGREWDEELDLYYYRSRYYDPQLGRFISEDTYGFDAGDPNLYRYVVNGPTNASDPTGHVAAIEYATLAVKIAEKFIEPLGCIEDNLALLKVEFDPLGALEFIPKPAALGPLDNAKMIPIKAIFRGATGLKINKVTLDKIILGEVPLAEAQDLYVTVTACSRFLPAAHFAATMAQLATVLDLYTRSRPHTTVTSSFSAESPDEISQFSLKVFGSLSRGTAAAGGSGPNFGGPNDPRSGVPPVSGGGPGGVAGAPGSPSPFGSVSGDVAYLCHIRDRDDLSGRLIVYSCEDFAWNQPEQVRVLGIATELIDPLDLELLLRGPGE